MDKNVKRLKYPTWYVVIGFRQDRTTISLVPPYLCQSKAKDEAQSRNLSHTGYPSVLAWGIRAIARYEK